MGLYERKGSRFWWMSSRGSRTKTTSKDLAGKIWKKREGEIALGLFKVGWPGERMTFAELCEEFLRSHTAAGARQRDGCYVGEFLAKQSRL